MDGYFKVLKECRTLTHLSFKAKRVAQSADELVVIPIDDPADQSSQLIPDTAAASGFFKVKRTPQTDELVVIPIDGPVDSGASTPGQESNSNSF